MATAKKTRRRTATHVGPATALRTLGQRLARLEARLKAERAQHARELAAQQRAADRRMASLVREIAGLRHHEARADTLARLLSERDAALASQADQMARLETLLQAAPR